MVGRVEAGGAGFTDGEKEDAFIIPGTRPGDLVTKCTVILLEKLRLNGLSQSESGPSHTLTYIHWRPGHR